MRPMDIEKLNIDKSDWKLTRLGDLAEEVSKRVDTPSESGYDRFVGLEHFYSGDLRIKDWGGTKNLVSSAKAFQAGDILLARRNAYLRRASLVDFDGCCSGDAFVLRENHDSVVPGFLAFVVNSNGLWDYANDNAAGTMSKRVKWRDLANYEFLLPPKAQQAKLAELLWAMEEVVQLGFKNQDKLVLTAEAIFIETLFEKSVSRDPFFINISSRHEVRKLSELLTELQYGISESLSTEIGIPILRMNNLQNGKLDLSDLKYYAASDGELDKFILQKGDILFNRTNSFDLVGKVSLFEEEGTYSFASYLIRIKVDKKRLDPRFLNYYLNSSIGLSKIRKYRTPGVSQSNINAQNLKRIPVPYPSLEIQIALMDKIELFQKAERIAIEEIRNAESLQKSLINQVFS